ncbi:MAG: glycosyltransferase family 2 protein [Bacteroidaceae bacterium]|nr:glycosyltransferase family 2 protein [Bacteroidaceae bacterium]
MAEAKKSSTEYLVSVIIPTFNRAEQVCDCVYSLLESTHKNLEIIVVDNASTDDTVARLEHSFGDKITVLKLRENLMAAGGRNQGIKVAKGDFLMFLDNDNMVTPDMIEKLVDFASKDESIGLVGPLTLQANDDMVIWTASGRIRKWSSRPENLYAGKRVEEVSLEEVYPTELSPNCMMISRTAIEAVGGFDTSYYAMYEESDIGSRILKAGFKEFILTSAMTNHYETVSKDGNLPLRKLGAWPAERAFHFAKNRFVYMKKYASFYQRLVFYVFWGPLFTVYYVVKALQCKDTAVAKAWMKGTFKGLATKVDKNIRIEL